MNYNTTNIVTLCGVVETNPVLSHEIYGEKFYEVELKIKRLSEQFDIVPITVSERLFSSSMLEIGAEICVIGQFRSYNKIIDDKSKLMLTVFVREIVSCVPSPNNIELYGYICKPPVFRTTPFNREICDLLIAVNRAYNKSDYIPCIAWGRNARFVKYLSVGEQVVVFGRIQSRQYQKRINEEETVQKIAYEVSISKILIGESAEQMIINRQMDLKDLNEQAYINENEEQGEM